MLQSKTPSEEDIKKLLWVVKHLSENEKLAVLYIFANHEDWFEPFLNKCPWVNKWVVHTLYAVKPEDRDKMTNAYKSLAESWKEKL